MPNKRASKYMKKKLTKLKEKIDTFQIIVADFNIFFSVKI